MINYSGDNVLLLMRNIPFGVSKHKCMFIQLSATQNMLLVSITWLLVSGVISSHHQATTQEQQQ